MDLNCQLLLYLDKRHFISKMKNSCQSYIEELNEKSANKFLPLRYLLEIDVMDLIEHFPCSGEFLLKEPMKWRNICSEILYACLQSINNEQYTISPTQVAVNLRFKSLPRLLSRPNPRSFTGVVTFYGLLIAISKPTSYVYHTVWSCPEDCENNEVIVQYIPKVPLKCSVCRSVLFENSGLRRCGEQVAATFKLKNNLMPKHFMIVDDLIPKLKLGSTFSVSAVVVKKATSVWSVEEIVTLPAPMTSVVPSDIEKLYSACDGLPWQFVYCLASSIAVDICPLNCFMQLKISLLLSLASIKANMMTGSTIIHVLAAGYDTGYVGRIMEEGAKLADRAVLLGTSNTVASTALIGSSGGVCAMPLPLHTYSQKQISAILSSIEAGDIQTESDRVQLQCAVWAQGMDFKKITLLNVASVFGAVCRGDCGQYSDEVVEFVLQKAIDPMRTSSEEMQALKDVARYIDITAGINVRLNKNTEMLLRNYFLAARKERPRGVTVGSMGALVSACLTSARLCRRAVTNTEDAVLAIWLHVSGGPEPRFAPEEYLQTPADVKKLKTIINNFKDWLQQFTSSYIS